MSNARKRNRYIPSFDCLEDRIALASRITVNSTADGNNRDEVLTFREAIKVSNGIEQTKI